MPPGLGYCDPAGLPSRRYSSDRVVPTGSLGTHAPHPRLVRHFGIGPALALRCVAGDGAPSAQQGRVIVFRFCIVYGVISILMTPFLGASADRLVEYGWPFYSVVLPWFLSASYDLRGLRTAGLLRSTCLPAGWPGLPSGTPPATCLPVWEYWP